MVRLSSQEREKRPEQLQEHTPPAGAMAETKTRFHPGKIEAGADERVVLLHGQVVKSQLRGSEAEVVGHMVVAHKLRIREPFNADTDVAALAQRMRAGCKLIKVTALPQVEFALQALKERETKAGTYRSWLRSLAPPRPRVHVPSSWTLISQRSAEDAESEGELQRGDAVWYHNRRAGAWMRAVVIMVERIPGKTCYVVRLEDGQEKFTTGEFVRRNLGAAPVIDVPEPGANALLLVLHV